MDGAALLRGGRGGARRRSGIREQRRRDSEGRQDGSAAEIRRASTGSGRAGAPALLTGDLRGVPGPNQAWGDAG